MVDAIRRLCKEHGKTLFSIEKECGFGNGTINKWDNNSPSVAKVLAVAKALGVPVIDLIKDDVEDDAHEGPSPQFIRRTELLKRRGISLSELSQKTGISVHRLRRYFSEDTLGQTDFWNEYPKLARALGVSPQYLHCLTDEENDESDTDERFCDWVVGHSNIREFFSGRGMDVEQEKKPTPVSEDGLDAEQAELVRLFKSASPALRAAALAVLKSAEAQGKAQDGASEAE